MKYVEPFCLTSLSIEVEKRWLQLTGLWKIQIFEVSLHADNLVTILARQKEIVQMCSGNISTHGQNSHKTSLHYKL